MSLEEMVDIVIDWLRASGSSALIMLEACSKGKLEKSYNLITNNPQMTLDEFVEIMGIIEED